MPGPCTQEQAAQQESLLNQIVEKGQEAIDAAISFWDLLVDEALPQIPSDHPSYNDSQLLIQEWPLLKGILTRQITNNEEYKQLILDIKEFLRTSNIFSRLSNNNPEAYDRIYDTWVSFENGEFDREYSYEECEEHISKLNQALQRIIQEKSYAESAYASLSEILSSGDIHQLADLVYCYFIKCLTMGFTAGVIVNTILKWAAKQALVAGAVIAGATVSQIIGIIAIMFSIVAFLYCIMEECHGQT